VHIMPKKATTSAAASNMGPRTRSCSQQNIVGEAPPTDEQEERNLQAALAQTARDEAARTVEKGHSKKTSSVAQLENRREGRGRSLSTIFCAGSTPTTRN